MLIIQVPSCLSESVFHFKYHTEKLHSSLKLREIIIMVKDSTSKHGLTVLMFPWLAHGHISPFLELAKKLAQRNFHVYICSSPVNLQPLRESLPQTETPFSSIQLIDIHLPFSSQLPPHYHSTKNVPPHLMSTLKVAFDASEHAFYEILTTLKPDILIYDFLQPWAPMAASQENITSILFMTFGAATCSFLNHFFQFPSKENPFPEFNIPKSEHRKTIQFMYDVANGVTTKERYLKCIERSSRMVLIKTSTEIEAKYIDYLSVLAGKEIVVVGPLVQEPLTVSGSHDDNDGVIMEWLGKKEKSSVVFVSFGTEYFLSKDEIEEIAIGLELSKVNFIWVVRFHAAEKVSLHEALPEGFQKRVEDGGMVIEGWAPQAKILRHKSIAGFVSHCGWSSTLEGIMFGVPIIAMPMHLDQPLNAKVVVEIGVGMEVKREHGRFRREDVAKVIREVVVQEKGKKVRENVNKISKRMKEKCDEEIDNAIEKIAQLVRES